MGSKIRVARPCMLCLSSKSSSEAYKELSSSGICVL
jgi:hypothetical protein